jgi:hypothetical protein
MSLASTMLKTQYNAPGLYDTGRQQNMSWKSRLPLTNDDCCQIVHVSGNHWVTLAKYGGLVYVFDSLGSLTHPLPSVLHDVVKLMFVPQHLRNEFDPQCIHIPRMKKVQSGPNDCGLFAIAYAECLVRGVLPTDLNFVQESMRHHLFDCLFRDGQILPFPLAIDGMVCHCYAHTLCLKKNY